MTTADDAARPGPTDGAPVGRRRRVGLPGLATFTGRARHRLWRTAFRAVGGFHVEGRAPVEAMVIVANHASHVDTPAILAAFPAAYRPMAVAAGDYWFASPLRAWAARTFVGAVPVDRTAGGGYARLVDEAQNVLGHGRSLLVFAEGTRTTDGTLRAFHAGAMHLAREFDVPLLPVAIVGTHRLKPKGGAMVPGPVEVRVGSPIDPYDWDERGIDAARDQIEALLAQGPARVGVSPLWRRVNRFVAQPAGLVAAFGWGMAEALVWPITNEAFLAIFSVANPRRIPQVVAAQTAGSVAGVLVNAALARRGVRVPAPLTTTAMRDQAARHVAQRGAAGIWGQALNGVPVKLYARAAADAGVPMGRLAAHTLGARGARAAAVGAVTWVAARKLQPFLKRELGLYETAFAAVYGVGLALVIRRWRGSGPGTS